MDQPHGTPPIPRAALAGRARAGARRARRTPVESPGQMTYGSQAAAASQVFEQQRDLALRDRGRAAPRGRRCGARPARRGHLRPCELRQADRARAARGDPVGGAVHRLPRAEGQPMTRRRGRRIPPRATVTRRSSGSTTSGRRGDACGASRAHAARGVRARRTGPAAEGRVAAADRRVQDPRRVPRRSRRCRRRSGPAAW